MQNWCDNAGFIQITDRTTEKGREIFKKLAEHGTNPGWFSAVYPPPAEMYTGIGHAQGRAEYMSLDWLRANSQFTGDFGTFEGEPGKHGFGRTFYPTEAYLDYLRQTFGATNWYDWSVRNWGTKWDVELSSSYVYDTDPNVLHFQFSSAWSPPVAFFQWLSEEELDWGLDFIELGCWFAGTVEYVNGDAAEIDFSGEDVILFAIDHFDMAIEFLTRVDDYESFEDYEANHKHGPRVTELVRNHYLALAENTAQIP